jgi:hypothetical protein
MSFPAPLSHSGSSCWLGGILLVFLHEAKLVEKVINILLQGNLWPRLSRISRHKRSLL